MFYKWFLCYSLVYFEAYRAGEGQRRSRKGGRVEESCGNWRCDDRKIRVICVLGGGIILDQRESPGGKWHPSGMGQQLESSCRFWQGNFKVEGVLVVYVVMSFIDYHMYSYSIWSSSVSARWRFLQWPAVFVLFCFFNVSGILVSPPHLHQELPVPQRNFVKYQSASGLSSCLQLERICEVQDWGQGLKGPPWEAAPLAVKNLITRVWVLCLLTLTFLTYFSITVVAAPLLLLFLLSFLPPLPPPPSFFFWDSDFLIP